MKHEHDHNLHAALQALINKYCASTSSSLSYVMPLTDDFLEGNYSLNSKIKFTIDEAINFLDLKISKKDANLEFNVYRKPTFTDTIIPYDSLHHLSQKIYSFNSMIHRTLHLPLFKENLDSEK